MELNINLRIELSPTLEKLMERLTSLPQADQTVKQAPLELKAEPTPAEEATPEPVPAKAEEKAPEPKYPSNEDLRGMMDMTISKFAGNSWKDSKEPRVLAIRKGCTEMFKKIAKHFGSDKPTQLEGEARNKFCDELSRIYIEEKENGLPEIDWLPF